MIILDIIFNGMYINTMEYWIVKNDISTNRNQQQYELYWISPGGNTPQTADVRPPTAYQENH